MNFFGFGSGPEIEIIPDDHEKRKTAEIKTEDGKKERHLLYYDGESVSGKVKITLRKGSKLEHQGIRIELIGLIELYYDRGNQHNFLSLYQDIARPGELLQLQTFKFDFCNVEKPFETYTGTNCKLRYFLRVSVMKRLTDIIKELELAVHTVCQYPDANNSIKMEVGIEDCLHIEFEYNRSKYHLKDVIVGKIYFLLVRIKIKNMELAIIKRETTGSGPNTFNENETIAKFEIMDGAPVRGESIPIRVFLSGYDLTPTFRDVNRKFSVRYFLNLVLVDEEDRRYFKQQEIVLWRKLDKPRKSFQASLQQQYREMQNPNVQVSPCVTAEPKPGTSKSCNFNGHENRSDESVVETVEGLMTTNKKKPAVVKKNDYYDDDDDDSEESTGEYEAEKYSQGRLISAKKGTTNDKEKLSQDEMPPAVAAGTVKALSGDDSDDDVPTLTGSICQAEVHNVSHEVALDAAAVVVDFDQKHAEEKCVSALGKEE